MSVEHSGIKNESTKLSISKIIEDMNKQSRDLVNVGCKYIGEKKFDEAIDAFLKAIEINPLDAVAYTNLGHAYCDKGLYEDATKNLKKAIKLNPKLVDAYEILATLYAEKNFLSEAIKYYEKAQKVNPTDPVLLFNVGNTFLRQGLLDEAIDNLIKAIKIKPDCASYHDTLGFVYSKKGLSEKAITHFKEAVCFEPNNWQYHQDLAIEYQEIGLNGKAIEEWKQAILFGPKEAALHNDIAVAYVNEGLLDKARGELEEALKIDPTFELAKSNLSILTQAIEKLPQKSIPNKSEIIKVKRSTKVSEEFNLIENRLRKGILKNMESAFGEQWWKQQVPFKIQTDCANKKEKDAKGKIKWGKKPKDFHPIYYSDFIQLKEIIVNGNNWNKVFNAFYESKELVQLRFDEVHQIIRNDVAHNRNAFSQKDLNRLRYFDDDIVNKLNRKNKAKK